MLHCAKTIVGLIIWVAFSGCSPLSAVNALTPSGTYAVRENIAYGPAARNRLDVYEPRAEGPGLPPANGYPVVMFFYGGTWTSGSRADYRFVGEALASRGIVTIIVVISTDHCNTVSSRWAGVLKPNVLRGLVFKLNATRSR